jgi:hypothetical protein
MVEKARLGAFDAIISRTLVGYEGACGPLAAPSSLNLGSLARPAIQLKEFPVKKIALSVVIASSVALAACGGGAANNTAAAEGNALTNAIDTMNQVASDTQNQAAAAMNQVSAAAIEAAAATQDAANAAHSAVANASNAAGH